MPTKRRAFGRSLSLILGALVGLSGCSTGDGEKSGVSGTAPDPEPSSIRADQTPRVGVLPAKRERRKKPLSGVQVSSGGRRITRLDGLVAESPSPDTAAEDFRQTKAEEFGVEPRDLVPVAPRDVADVARSAGASPAATSIDASEGLGLMWNADTGVYKFRLYSYEQQRDGVPVYGGALRTLVRVEGDNPVVWANADLRSVGNFVAPASIKTDAVDHDKSLLALKSDPDLVARGIASPTALGNFSTPTPTIFAGIGDKSPAPRMALKYTASDADGPASWTFLADAATGDVLHVESNQHYNIEGTIEAEVITGVESLLCGSLGIEPLAYARVTSPVGDAVADQAGAFTIVESGSGSVNITSSVTGEYFNVIDKSESGYSLSLQVTPPGPADFFHQDTAATPGIVLGQLNAYKHANALRDLLLVHVPQYPVISTETGFEINVNNTGDTPRDLCAQTGGGWYDGDRIPASINFCQGTDTRANTTMGSIVHHEYGHHIIASGGSKQAEYGEGMADTIAMLFSEDPEIGIGFRLDCGEPMRRANNDCQYSESDCSSCGSGLYECGALISGVVWDIWQQLDLTEPANATEIIRSLVFNSIPLHTGTSIDPSIAVDMLTLDDDDGVIENGTPHYQEICTGFALHNMDCPPILDGLVVHGADFEAGGPSDGPFEPASITYTLYNLGPQEDLSYSVQIPSDATWLSVDSAGGTIALGSQATVTVLIDQAVAAALPDGRYTAGIDFINADTGIGNVSRDASLRVGVPEPIYTATFDDGLDGFIVDASDYDNLWHQTTACVDELPGHSSPGSLYYGRDDQCNHSTSVPNRHWVTSPTIQIENPQVVDLGFNYYLRTERPGSDIVEILISVNGGPFETVASNTESGEPLDETTAWEEMRFEISERLPGSGPISIQLQFAFDAGSPGDNGETGFLIDDVTVYAGTQSSNGILVPARIEAEDYQRFSDTTSGNTGGGCSTGDDVDKEVTLDSAGGGCNVGWTEAGEWLEYDITVATPQTFDVITRAATANAGKSFRIEVDGVDVTGALNVPANGWQNYSDIVAEGIPLSAGNHVVRLYMITNYINVNYIVFQTISGVQVPARIEAEDYQRFGDTTSGNTGGGCSTGDDVDKEVTLDSAGGGCNVGWTEAGEWLEYDITVATPQTFDVITRAATANAGKRFRIEVDGVDVTGALTVPANGWQSYSDIVAEGISLSAGSHVVRLYMITNYINVNYILFQVSGSGGSCGDGECEASENCGTCAQDCGTCSGGCTCPSGCGSVQNASVPFARDGVMNACYFVSGSLGGHMNSWNMTSVNINGVSAANVWLGASSYPGAVDGGYYLYVDGDFAWSHVELN